MGQLDHPITTVYSWCDDHSTSISVSKVWEAKIGVRVSKRELHTYIYLDLVRVDSILNKKKKIDHPIDLGVIIKYSHGTTMRCSFLLHLW